MSTMSVIVLFIVLIVTLINSQPYYVSYIDFPTCGSGVTDADCLAALGVPGYSSHNYNVLNLAFYVSSEDAFYDASNVWANPSWFFTQSFRDSITGKSSSSDWDFRQAIKSKYSEAGVKLLLSVGGATDNPIESGIDATSLAIKIANFVWTYDYDGVDIDFENTEYFASNDGVGEEWLITLTRQLYNTLGSSYIITHAPMAPYLGAPNYSYGAYSKIHEQVGNMISWYNVQFYNQGTTSYDTYNTLFITSNGWATNTAVQQIISGSNSLGISIPSNKIVIGKYIRSGVDGFSGWISANNLNTYFNQFGWNNGFMLWQFPGDKDQGFAFSDTIIGSSKPSIPSSSSTPAPVSSNNGNIIITNSGTLNTWWYAGIVTNSASTVSKFEVLYNGNNWFSCSNSGWAWTCSPDVAFELPLTIRLTSINGNTLTSWSLISNLNDGYAWNFGYNFGSSFTFAEQDDNDKDDSIQFPITGIIAISLLSCICIVIGMIIIGYCMIKRRKQKDAVSFKDDNDENKEVKDGESTTQSKESAGYDMSQVVIE